MPTLNPQPSRPNPSTDRHVHLFGCVDPATALDLAGGHAVDWSWLIGRWRDEGLDAPDLARLLSRHQGGDRDAARDLAQALAAGGEGFGAFQARYDLIVACRRWGKRLDRFDAGQDADGDLVVERAVAAHRAAGAGAAEFRVLLPMAATAAWCAAAFDRLASALRRAGPGWTIAVSVPRADHLRHWGAITAALDRGVPITGIDLCGIEDEPDDHRDLAAAVAAWNASHPQRGLSFLVHAGEQLAQVQPGTAIRRVHAALRLGADRLGHALAARLEPTAWPATPAWERCDERRRQLAWEAGLAGRLGLDRDALRDELAALDRLDAAAQLAPRPRARDAGFLRACQEVVLGEIAAHGTVLEVCPTSNRVISGVPLATHGLARLDAAGVAWEVGSDDPGILGTTLARERMLAAELSSTPDSGAPG